MYIRPIATLLKQRLSEPPLRIQILAGPRQIGKTTLVRQLLQQFPSASLFVAADAVDDAGPVGLSDSISLSTSSPGRLPNVDWLVEQWQRARKAAQQWSLQQSSRASGQQFFIFVIDEIHKIPRWSETIKGLWDQQQAENTGLMHLVLLGSAPLLMQKGMSESLAGRFETIHMTHWSFDEMREAFNYTLEQYLYFGGFPGAARLIQDEARWRSYILDSLITPNIRNDILMMTRVDKPALLRHLFELGCLYSGQIVALSKLQGELHDAGNTTTLAGYLDLLGHAGLLTGLHKYGAQAHRKRQSPPKLNVLNTALMSALGSHTYAQAQMDRSYWGRLVESTVGAHLCNSTDQQTRIHYWRESPHEVDFIIERAGKIAALEVKSGASHTTRHTGLEAFGERYPNCKRWVVGSAGDISLDEFLRHPSAYWIEGELNG